LPLKIGLLPAVNADLNAAVLAAVDQYAVRDEQAGPTGCVVASPLRL
jgi:hypothetical protein